MKNTKIKIFIAIAIIALAGGAAFWFFLSRDGDRRSTPLDQDLTGQVSEKSADMLETYANPKYGFSFSYQKELSVSEFADDNGYIVLVQPSASDQRTDQRQVSGFQVYITPFDEPFDSTQGKPGPITKERILKDVPSMAISNDKLITLGGVSALSFKSKDESGGETLEIWFVRNDYLYQISALASFGGKLQKILATWEFR